MPLAAEDGERENFHRSARALPAAPGHAGHINRRYDTAGQPPQFSDERFRFLRGSVSWDSALFRALGGFTL